MADVTLIIDPDETSFALHDSANGRRLLGFDAPVPETDSQWAYSADTEGERRANLRYRNRTITADILLERSTAALLEAAENLLGQKIGKLAREGGELRFAYPTGTTITFNVLEASFYRTFDIADMARFRARYQIAFLCEPFGLGAIEDLGDNTETTLPCLIFTETNIKGDVPALGRLVIDDDSGADQYWLIWGLQSRHYNSDSDAALFHQAEARTALGGAASTAVAGASGGNVIRQGSLTTTYQALLSTQASGGGGDFRHIGTFRVFGRVLTPATNTGDVSVALEWAVGDFSQRTRNTATAFAAGHARADEWVLVDLGQVVVPEVTVGTQQWQGRIVAKSTVDGDDLDTDYLMLIPVDEGSGEVTAVELFETPSTLSAHDQFNQSAGALTGKTAGTGGTWAGAGDADDFAVETSGKTAQRTAVSDAASTTGRFAVSGVSGFTAQAVQVDLKLSTVALGAGGFFYGVLARYTDVNNWILAGFNFNGAEWHIGVYGRAASSDFFDSPLTEYTPVAATWYTLRLVVTTSGRWVLWFGERGDPAVIAGGQRSELATGGALATGKPGFYDAHTGSTACTRNYDNFLAFAPTTDAAMFASQSLRIQHDRVVRENAGGTAWTAPSSYAGDYLLVPPAGAEGRTTRIIVKGTRSDPVAISDQNIDDISARLFVTPRFLVVPDA